MEEKQQYVNASGAAQVTGWSLRTIITRLGRGEIAGAEAVNVPGRPREWRIPLKSLDDLPRPPSALEDRVAALELEVARLAALLEAAAVRTPPATPKPPSGPLSASQSHSGVPADWQVLSAFAERHGVSEGSATGQRRAKRAPFTAHELRAGMRSWWYLDPAEQRAALAYWFGATYHPKPGTHVQRCSDPQCVCHELLPAD